MKLVNNKNGVATVDTVVRILIVLLCGSLLLTGTYGIVKYVVLPNSVKKTKMLYDYTGDGGFSKFQENSAPADFHDGENEYFYYTSVEDAIKDAKNNSIANSSNNKANASAVVGVDLLKGTYSVSKLENDNSLVDIAIDGVYTYDSNGNILYEWFPGNW